jgi:hypothetical protein
VLGSEQLARHWLNHALPFLMAHDPQLAIVALNKAIKLKQTPLARVVRDFMVRQQCQRVLGLLQNNDLMAANKMISLLHDLNHEHEFINQLHGFTQHLLAKGQHADNQS